MRCLLHWGKATQFHQSCRRALPTSLIRHLQANPDHRVDFYNRGHWQWQLAVAADLNLWLRTQTRAECKHSTDASMHFNLEFYASPMTSNDASSSIQPGHVATYAWRRYVTTVNRVFHLRAFLPTDHMNLQHAHFSLISNALTMVAEGQSTSFSLAVIFIIRLFSISIFRVWSDWSAYSLRCRSSRWFSEHKFVFKHATMCSAPWVHQQFMWNFTRNALFWWETLTLISFLREASLYNMICAALKSLQAGWRQYGSIFIPKTNDFNTAVHLDVSNRPNIKLLRL